MFKKSDQDAEPVKRGFVEDISAFVVIRCLDDGQQYTVNPNLVYVYKSSYSKKVSTFLCHLKYTFPTCGHKLNLNFEKNENGDAGKCIFGL